MEQASRGSDQGRVKLPQWAGSGHANQSGPTVALPFEGPRLTIARAVAVSSLDTVR